MKSETYKLVIGMGKIGKKLEVSKWKEDLDSKVQLPDGSPIPCILLANKVSDCLKVKGDRIISILCD